MTKKIYTKKDRVPIDKSTKILNSIRQPTNVETRNTRNTVLVSKTDITYIKILLSRNNCLIVLSSFCGTKVYKSFSLGKLGFKNAQKSSQLACITLAQEVGDFIKEHQPSYKFTYFIVQFYGINKFKRLLLRQLIAHEAITTKFIKYVDITPLPHNGCRRANPKKR